MDNFDSNVLYAEIRYCQHLCGWFLLTTKYDVCYGNKRYALSEVVVVTRKANLRSDSFTSALDAWSQRLHRAGDRVGRAGQDRLRWLLTTVQRDLFALPDGEWDEVQDDLHAVCIAPGVQTPAHSASATDAAPPRLANDEVRVLLQNIKDGIRRFLTGPGWVFSVARIKCLVTRRKRGGDPMVIEGDLKTRVLWATADLLRSHGTRIKICLECKRLFLPIRRQAYCAKRCSQRVRTRRFRAAQRQRASRRKSQTAPQVNVRIGRKRK